MSEKIAESEMLGFFHPQQRLHKPQTYLSRGALRTPQEVADRVEPLLHAAAALGVRMHEPADFGLAPIEAVHDARYVRFLREAHQDWLQHPDWGAEVIPNVFVRGAGEPKGVLAKAAYYQADGSCPIGAGTYEAAYHSAQSAIAAAHAVAAGARQAYALCRPPGHHARRAAAGGFCYLNNTAIAAQALRQTFARVAILDTDMHHGQGTQEIFYDRDDVLFVSIHGDPVDFYPVVAGFADERGAGKGEGFNLNLPMKHGETEAGFFDTLARGVAAVQAFAPDALVLSLGFDIFELDPQALVSVSTAGFARLGGIVGALRLPTVIVQEGGYHLESLAQNADAFFRAFMQARA